jgi:hypothetical protein
LRPVSHTVNPKKSSPEFPPVSPLYNLNQETTTHKGFAIDVSDAGARQCNLTVRYVVYKNWEGVNRAIMDVARTPSVVFSSHLITFIQKKKIAQGI